MVSGKYCSNFINLRVAGVWKGRNNGGTLEQCRAAASSNAELAREAESKLFVVGSQSGKQTKTITIQTGYTCAAEINKSNWNMVGLPHATGVQTGV